MVQCSVGVGGCAGAADVAGAIGLHLAALSQVAAPAIAQASKVGWKEKGTLPEVQEEESTPAAATPLHSGKCLSHLGHSSPPSQA